MVYQQMTVRRVSSASAAPKSCKDKIQFMIIGRIALPGNRSLIDVLRFRYMENQKQKQTRTGSRTVSVLWNNGIKLNKFHIADKGPVGTQ